MPKSFPNLQKLFGENNRFSGIMELLWNKSGLSLPVNFGKEIFIIFGKLFAYEIFEKCYEILVFLLKVSEENLKVSRIVDNYEVTLNFCKHFLYNKNSFWIIYTCTAIIYLDIKCKIWKRYCQWIVTARLN